MKLHNHPCLLIARIEVFKLIRHPMTAGILLIAFLFFSMLFHRLCVDYLQLAHAAIQDREIIVDLSLEIIKPFFSWSIIVFAIILPLFSTTTFSQEYRQKTFYVWATSTTRPTELVLGKFFCHLSIIFTLLLMMLMLLLSLTLETSLEWGLLTTSFLGVLLISSCLLSFSMFISSIITHPLLAMCFSFIGSLSWILIEWLNPMSGAAFFILKELALLNHTSHLMTGILYSPDILFYLLICGFWLTLTTRVITFRMKTAL